MPILTMLQSCKELDPQFDKSLTEKRSILICEIPNIDWRRNEAIEVVYTGGQHGRDSTMVKTVVKVSCRVAKVFS